MYESLYAGETNKVTIIARLLGVSKQAVSKRLDKLQQSQKKFHPDVLTEGAMPDVFDIRRVLSQSYKRLVEHLDSGGLDGDSKTRAIAEARKFADSALKCLEALYRVEEVRAFQEDVLTVLAEVDPALRQKVFEKIADRRSLRGAFGAE